MDKQEDHVLYYKMFFHTSPSILLTYETPHVVEVSIATKYFFFTIEAVLSPGISAGHSLAFEIKLLVFMELHIQSVKLYFPLSFHE